MDLSADAITELGWVEDAACRGMDLSEFFGSSDNWGMNTPSRPERERIHRAKQVCRSCPVIVECREHAVALPEPYGVWGGTTRRERDPLRKKLREYRARKGSTNDSTETAGG